MIFGGSGKLKSVAHLDDLAVVVDGCCFNGAEAASSLSASNVSDLSDGRVWNGFAAVVNLNGCGGADNVPFVVQLQRSDSGFFPLTLDSPSESASVYVYVVLAGGRTEAGEQIDLPYPTSEPKWTSISPSF